MKVYAQLNMIVHLDSFVKMAIAWLKDLKVIVVCRVVMMSVCVENVSQTCRHGAKFALAIPIVKMEVFKIIIGKSILKL